MDIPWPQAMQGSSPHTRGAPADDDPAAAARRIIPAYAGSTVPPPILLSRPSGSSPHTRGAPDPAARTDPPRRIIPAYAGSTRTRRPGTACGWDHPRIRGEHDDSDQYSIDGLGSSPHTRGARYRISRSDPARRIIPAYAGSTRVETGGGRRMSDHPRIRGEHAVDVALADLKGGSSPHTRGAPPASWPWTSGRRIIPAYAGSTCRRHPPPPDACGSSPHTRGARRPVDAQPGPPRIIPAYAGSTYCYPAMKPQAADHPRIRGEHRSWRHEGASLLGSSPHTRGAPHTTKCGRRSTRIIPAYAGSTREVEGLDLGAEDHPRIRGEHTCIAKAPSPLRGSSPHTRGARWTPFRT